MKKNTDQHKVHESKQAKEEVAGKAFPANKKEDCLARKLHPKWLEVRN